MKNIVIQNIFFKPTKLDMVITIDYLKFQHKCIGGPKYKLYKYKGGGFQCRWVIL